MISIILTSLVLAGIFFGLMFTKENIITAIVSTVIVAVLIFCVNYLVMPVMNWGYFGYLWEVVILAILAVAINFFGMDLAYYDEEDGFEKSFRRSLIALGVSTLALILCAILSSPMCHSEKYASRLGKVEIVKIEDFSKDIKPIPLVKMRSVDNNLAQKVAEDKLGEDPGLGSRVYVGHMTIQCLTGEFTINGGNTLKFENDLVWVAPLEHSSWVKWAANDYTPGYIIVDACDPTRRWLVTEVNGQQLKMKYIESGCFNDDIERHLRFNGYMSAGLHDRNLEISPDGMPLWIITKFEKKIGFYGEEPIGVITVDPQNGEIREYTIAETPEWIDHIQPEDITLDQVNDWGKYKGGWWNSWTSEEDVQETTGDVNDLGMTLIYIDGKSYWYTGISSSGFDNGSNGFMLVDSRTKEAKLYQIPGMNELEALKIAQDQKFAQDAGYEACMPVLYNVDDVPTYFMIYKGGSGNIVGYCFLSLQNRNIVGCGTTKAEAEAAYRKSWRKLEKAADVETDISKKVVYTVRGIVQEEGVYYLLFKEVKGTEFTATSDISPELRWTREGDKVEVSYFEGEGAKVALMSFDKKGFEI